MNETKSNEDIVRNANVRLCRLRTWTNYKGLGFHIMECSRPPHLISLVESNSPAASGGLKILDVLLAINNKTVSDTDYAQVIITLKTVQKETDFLLELLVVEQHFYKILKKKNIAIQSSLANILNTPIRMPEDYIKFPKHIPRTCQIRLQSKDIDFGFDVISGINGIGMFVQEVIPNSPAYGAGLRKSDRIIEIEDEYVDKNTSKFILEKLRKAAVKKTVKLLVVDTKTYGLYVLNDPYVNKDDVSHTCEVVLHEKSPVPSVHRFRNNSESDRLKLSPSAHEYISVQNNQRPNTTITSQVKSRNDLKEFHSLTYPQNQNKSSTASRQNCSNFDQNYEYIQLLDYKPEEVTVEYEYPNDYNSSTSDFYENVPFHNRHQANATTILPLEHNDNSEYVDSSSIILDFDYKQTKNDHSIQEYVIKDDEHYQANERFFDVQNEPLVLFSLIDGYEHTPLLSLNSAIKNLEKNIPKIKQNASIALERSIHPTDGLTSDESASIQLFTMEWTPSYQSLSMKLNDALKAEDRDLLTPYFPYLKLVLTALRKLKSVNTIVWRGVKADLRAQYPIDKIFVWWGFGSCMESRDLLESDKYFGKKGIRTLFNIECKTGKSILSHSYDKHENEILLLPATQFQVINQDELTDDLYIIYLKEIESEYIPLQPSFDTDYSLVSLVIDKHSSPEESNLFQNQHLQEFVHNNKMENSICFSEQLLTINDMHLIANELHTNNYWCKISLHRTCLTEEHIKILMHALQSKLIVTSLDLMSNQLNDNTSSIIARALKINTSLENIDLTDNQITEIGAESFANMLSINKTLLNLNLSSNAIGDTGIIFIFRALQYNDTLKALYLNRTKLTDQSAQEMAINLTLNKNLQVLHLNENNLGDEGIMAISRSLIPNKQLNILHLTMNNITYVGAEKIAILLQETNSPLLDLNISGNPLRDAGVISIAQALTRNTTLLKLHLDSVEMTIDGLRELVKMIRTNDTLKYLSLKKNEINDDGIVLLLDGLQFNNVLTHLYLNDNKLTDGCILSLVNLLNNNPTLKCLYFSDNQITEQKELKLSNESTETNFTEDIYF